MSSFKIGERLIGADAPPFIIAEMSGNHNQSLERALQIVAASPAVRARDSAEMSMVNWLCA